MAYLLFKHYSVSSTWALRNSRTAFFMFKSCFRSLELSGFFIIGSICFLQRQDILSLSFCYILLKKHKITNTINSINSQDKLLKTAISNLLPKPSLFHVKVPYINTYVFSHSSMALRSYTIPYLLFTGSTNICLDNGHNRWGGTAALLSPTYFWNKHKVDKSSDETFLNNFLFKGSTVNYIYSLLGLRYKYITYYISLPNKILDMLLFT